MLAHPVVYLQRQRVNRNTRIWNIYRTPGAWGPNRGAAGAGAAPGAGAVAQRAGDGAATVPAGAGQCEGAAPPPARLARLSVAAAGRYRAEARPRWADAAALLGSG